MTTLTSYQLKALKLDKHIALTANAGSGKTFVLAQRFLKIVIDEKIPIKKIVAITFTDKAAGELYNKISKQIESELEIKSDNNKDKYRRSRLKNIREQLVSANISTIHSFCLNILKEFAPEANLDASFMPIDKETSNEILDISLEESFNEMIEDGNYSEQLKNAVRVLGSKSNLIKQLKLLVNKRRSFNKMKDDYLKSSLEEIIEKQKSLFEKYFSSIFVIREAELIERISQFNDDVKSQNPQNNFAGQIEELLERLMNNDLTKIVRLKTYDEMFNAMLKKDKFIKQQGYATKELIAENQELNEILNRQASIISKFDIENEGEILFTFAKFVKSFAVILEYIIEKYSQLKKEKGYIDFEDILLFTEEVLQNEEVISKLKEKYHYIMIDEFQDTNEIQINIFFPILENLTKGNLFVVGDEKQSIYMFRDAELSIFNDTKQIISEVDGSENLLNLPHSFRLSKEIAFFTNYLFSRLFENYDTKFNEVKYNELVYFDKDENPESKIEVLISDQTKEEYNSQAEIICSKIIELSNSEKVQLNQIAILCRKRNDFVLLEKELVKQNIPYTILGGRGFYQRQLVLDLYNYLSFLINQNNDSALLSILRSPFFSLSDSELFLLSFCDGKNLHEKLKKASKESEKIRRIYLILEDHIMFVSQNKLSDLLRKIFNDTAYITVIVKRINSRQELANIEKLFEVAQTYMNQGFRSLYDFVYYLNESIQLTEDEGQAEVSASENSIKIMTIHQSKGLEFDAVFIFNMQSNFNLTSIKSKDIDFDKEFGFISKVPSINYFDEYKTTNAVTLFGQLIKRKEIAEQKRLLYVAVTRAAKFLFLCYDDNGKTNENSFAGLVKKAIPNLSLLAPTKFSGTLKRMYKTEEIFNEDEIVVSLDLDLQTLSNNEKLNRKISESDENNFEINPQTIYDFSEGEVITASQFALFQQCPVKYQLIYEFGINEISELLPSKKKYESEIGNSPKQGTERGTIVHSVLSAEVKSEDLELFIKNKFSVDDDIIKESAELIKKYYSSEIFINFKNNGKHFNEFEVYTEIENFYLHGFIDKLIIDGSKAIIIDYKTDIINDENLSQKIEYYSNQILFYCKMIFEKFIQINSIEIKLIFLNSLEKSYSKEINRNGSEIISIKENLNNFISSIRERKYNFNKLGCGNCQFLINEKCIKEKLEIHE